MTPDRGDVLVVADDDSAYLAMTRTKFNRAAGLVFAYQVDRECIDDPLGVCLSGGLGQYWARADAPRTIRTTDITGIRDRVRSSEVGKLQRLLHVLLMH